MGDLTHANGFAKGHGLGYCAVMKYLAALVGLALLAFAPLQASAQSTPDDQYISIYNQIQQADSLQAAGQTSQALSGYTQALQQLQKFQKVYPDWNQRVVNFRINYLSQKVTSLTGTVATNAPTTATAPNAQSANASQTTTVAATDAKALQAQIKSLQDENAGLQAKLKEAFSAQPATGNAQELAMAQAQVKSLLKENELLRAATQKSSAAPKATDAKDAKELQLALATAKQKLTEETQRADKLALENQSLQARLQPLAKNPDAVQALREENAMLKKQVATLQAASKSSGGTDGSTELAKLRA